MNAADTSASSAIADWTPLTVASRSLTTDEIDTFISDVSTTSTNIAIDSRIGSRLLRASVGGEVVLVSAIVVIITRWSDAYERSSGVRSRVDTRIRISSRR